MALSITVQSVAESDKGLLLGLRVEHTQAGWIRFGVSLLVLEDLTDAERAFLTDRLNRAHMRVLDTTVEDEALPGL